MEIEKLILSSIGGATFTLIINGLIKKYEKRENLKRQKKIFINFIDNNLIKDLEKYVAEYDSLIEDIDKEIIFDGRAMSQSSMLRKHIFDFFEKNDLIKLFSYCKKFSIVDIYHIFYEIEYLSTQAPYVLYTNFISRIQKHFNEHRQGNETFFEHSQWCENYKQKRNDFLSAINIQRIHMLSIIDNFKEVRKELESIEDLKD